MNVVAMKVLSRFQAMRHSEEGATAVEYALMVALIAIAIIGAVYTLGGSVEKVFTDSDNCIKAPTATSCK
jgi:pilus assembly protein Flp/PilA